MPKRSPRNPVAEGQTAGERTEATPRTAKSNSVLDEETNRREMDEAAGVAEVQRSSLAPPPITRPQNAMPLLKADTREKRLYKIACTGTPLGAEFFDEFPNLQEILELALSISVRLLVVAICNSEVSPAQRISAMRLVAALNGKQLAPDEDEPGAKPTAPHTQAVDARSAMASIDKIRQLTKMEQ